jgi:poly-beta-1,6-N-acetyl-D-glucosamine synthase
MTFVLIFLLFSVFLLLLVVIGYPSIILFLSKIYPKKIEKRDFLGKLTVIIPCYNEQEVIEKKIENTFSLDYPQSRLEVIIVDSASNDGTWETLTTYSEKYPIRLIRQNKRRGKVSAINLALKETTGNVIVLTDADALLKKDALRKITAPFADSTIGAVVAKYNMNGRSPLSKVIGLLFSFFREQIRHYESILDSSSYFTGELLAFRRDLLLKIDEDIVADDQFILLEIRRKGFRCITEREAMVKENIPNNAKGTLEHKRRTVYGTLHVSSKFRDLLFNKNYGFFGCVIFPLSLARIIMIPFACFLVEISFVCFMVLTDFLLLFYLALFFIAFSLILGALKMDWLVLIFSIPILQVAMLLGIKDYLVGNSDHLVWLKVKKR